MDAVWATILGAILGAILTGPVTYIFTGKLFERQKFDSAATKFRSTILTELKSFYPVFIKQNGWQRESVGDKLPIILAACAEFNYFVSEKEQFKHAMVNLIDFMETHKTSVEYEGFYHPDDMLEWYDLIETLLFFSERIHEGVLIRQKIRDGYKRIKEIKLKHYS